MTTREVSYNLAGAVRNMSLPVAGTTIILYDYWSTGTGLNRHYLTEQVTGPKGEFSFDVRKGIYSIDVVPNRDTRFARQSFDTVRVNTNTTISIGLKHGCVYSGTVRTASGEPVVNCELLFFCIEPDAVLASEPVRPNGTFEVTLPKGKYYVACKSAPDSGKIGSVPKKGEPTSFVSPWLTILELWGDTRQDIVMPEFVSFKGVVTNAEGHPVQGVRVTITPSAANDVGFNADLKGVSYSNKIGQFECLVEPGTYDVLLEPGPDSHLSERRVSSILVDQARMRTYSLGQGYRFHGEVQFDDEPVMNALVAVAGGKIDSSTLTDEEGKFSFSLSGGRYEVTIAAQPDSLATLPFRLLAPYTCVINLAEDTELDVPLKQGFLISGKVVDKLGNPRPGTQLALYEDKGRPIDTTDSAQRALSFGITADDGSYEFRVMPGKYWLIVNNQQATAQLLEPQDDDIQNDIVWQTGCLISFQFLSESDEPIPHCQVFYEEYNANAIGDAAANLADLPGLVGGVDGICNIVLESGIYTFHVEPPEQGSFQSKQIRQFSINCDVRRKVRLPLKQVLADSPDQA